MYGFKKCKVRLEYATTYRFVFLIALCSVNAVVFFNTYEFNPMTRRSTLIQPNRHKRNLPSFRFRLSRANEIFPRSSTPTNDRDDSHEQYTSAESFTFAIK
jgi:hypothetical protein